MMCFFVAELKHGSIQVDSFAAHVKLMHTDGDYRFNQEFEVKSMIFIESKILIFLLWNHDFKNYKKNKFLYSEHNLKS